MNRRTWIAHAAVLLGGGVLGPLAASRPVAAQGRQGRGAAAAPDPGSSLILLGTQGGPTVNLQRAQPSSVIVASGVPYLVDCGYGAVRALVQAGLRLNDVQQVFVTHLHDDHTTDIAALLSMKWTAGQPRETTVYGPYGTAALVDGAIAFFRGNTDIRTVDEGRPVRPETLFRGRDLAAPAAAEVYRDERVRVRAVENTHYPERAKAKMPFRSFAYRLDFADRSYVFSGDTAYSRPLVELAREADVFVCEAMDVAMHAQLTKAAAAAPGGLSGESVARHVVETHSTTEDVGRMAAEARVKKVVLHHLLPGSNQRGGIPDSQYIESVRKHFQGEVIVGVDQMKI